MLNKRYLDHLEYQVTAACIEVHKALGPGLLVSVYQKCLTEELRLRNIGFVTEKLIEIWYKDIILDTQLKIDFIIEDCMILELKAVDSILPIHEAQILTYMKLTKIPCGILLNFNCTNIVQNGKKPFVNEFYRSL